MRSNWRSSTSEYCATRSGPRRARRGGRPPVGETAARPRRISSPRNAMFLVLTAYRDGRRPPQPVVEEHWGYLDGRYAEGRLLCSGPQDSGAGGVLVVLA